MHPSSPLLSGVCGHRRSGTPRRSISQGDSGTAGCVALARVSSRWLALAHVRGLCLLLLAVACVAGLPSLAGCAAAAPSRTHPPTVSASDLERAKAPGEEQEPVAMPKAQ